MDLSFIIVFFVDIDFMADFVFFQTMILTDIDMVVFGRQRFLYFKEGTFWNCECIHPWGCGNSKTSALIVCTREPYKVTQEQNDS